MGLQVRKVARQLSTHVFPRFPYAKCGRHAARLDVQELRVPGCCAGSVLGWKERGAAAICKGARNMGGEPG